MHRQLLYIIEVNKQNNIALQEADIWVWGEHRASSADCNNNCIRIAFKVHQVQ